MNDVSTNFVAILIVWALATWILSRWLPRATALDIANTGVLVYLMVVSVIDGEFSIAHLIG